MGSGKGGELGGGLRILHAAAGDDDWPLSAHEKSRGVGDVARVRHRTADAVQSLSEE